jgi:hypothetical protein
MGRRLDSISGWIRMWALLTLGAYFIAVIFTGRRSGLLPPPWDEIVSGIGAAALGMWNAWKSQKPAKLER